MSVEVKTVLLVDDEPANIQIVYNPGLLIGTDSPGLQTLPSAKSHKRCDKHGINLIIRDLIESLTSLLTVKGTPRMANLNKHETPFVNSRSQTNQRVKASGQLNG